MVTDLYLKNKINCELLFKDNSNHKDCGIHFIYDVNILNGILSLRDVNVLLSTRVGDPYEKMFVLTFQAYGPNAVSSMRLEHQNKYFLYGPSSLLVKALFIVCVSR